MNNNRAIAVTFDLTAVMVCCNESCIPKTESCEASIQLTQLQNYSAKSTDGLAGVDSGQGRASYGPPFRPFVLRPAGWYTDQTEAQSPAA